MIEAILPASVRSAESRGEEEPPPLPAAEEALVSGAVAKRRFEFAAGRDCARRALGALGVPPAPILSGRRGEPLWPQGVVGAITHCAGYRAGAVARSSEVAALGIDAEPRAPLPAGVLETIAREEEIARLQALAGSAPGIPWDRLLFGAKESIYKAWYPRTRLPLEFAEASVSFDAERCRFTARLLVAGPTASREPWSELRGRWLIADGLVLTAVAVTA
ncbi:MAG TPA: 4'-phosphopantetheinyl transferase superfamily protein [Solirubrobacterales bacterium]|nr:4'-phosphopantetheinyl transferase superfamily protein [Solirubrobacterales bacterium]